MTDQGQFFDCQGCGARLTFKPGSDSLTCEYCGHEQSIAASSSEGSDGVAVLPAEVVEHDFREALRNARRKPAAELMVGGKEVNCSSCGATTVLSKQAGNCPYCDSPVVASTTSAKDEGVIVPESVLPFKLTDEILGPQIPILVAEAKPAWRSRSYSLNERGVPTPNRSESGLVGQIVKTAEFVARTDVVDGELLGIQHSEHGGPSLPI